MKKLLICVVLLRNLKCPLVDLYITTRYILEKYLALEAIIKNNIKLYHAYKIIQNLMKLF